MLLEEFLCLPVARHIQRCIPTLILIAYNGLMLGWDPSANSNKGEYTNTRTTAIKLRDTLEMGIYGSDGTRGVARIKFDGNGKWFGELLGLECP